MKYTQIFSKTSKTAPKDEEATNAKLLIRAGYIDKTMAGVYSFLPLGNLVLKKIETIVREEMDKIGSEILLPAISPKSIWEQTKRLEEIDVMLAVRGANELSRKRNSAEYILNSTHEDVLTPIAPKKILKKKKKGGGFFFKPPKNEVLLPPTEKIFKTKNTFPPPLLKIFWRDWSKHI